MKKVTSKYFLLVCMLTMVLSGCTQTKASDINEIIDDMANYTIETTPYEEKITFTLSSEKRLKETEEPIKIETIYDTTIYVTEIRERKSNGVSDIVVGVELKSDMHPSKGTVLSLISKTEQGMTMTGGMIAYDDKGNRATPGGTGKNRETHNIHFDTSKHIYMQSDQWTFEIVGLNVLKYYEK